MNKKSLILAVLLVLTVLLATSAISAEDASNIDNNDSDSNQNGFNPFGQFPIAPDFYFGTSTDWTFFCCRTTFKNMTATFACKCFAHSIRNYSLFAIRKIYHSNDRNFVY